MQFYIAAAAIFFNSRDIKQQPRSKNEFEIIFYNFSTNTSWPRSAMPCFIYDFTVPFKSRVAAICELRSAKPRFMYDYTFLVRGGCFFVESILQLNLDLNFKFLSPNPLLEFTFFMIKLVCNPIFWRNGSKNLSLFGMHRKQRKADAKSTPS